VDANGHGRDGYIHTVYRVAQKIGTILLYALASSNINRLSKSFHCQNQEKICNNTIIKDPTTDHTSSVSLHYLLSYKAPRRGVLPSRPRPIFKTFYLFSIVAFKSDISQGSVATHLATHLSCGGSVITNFHLILTVK